MKEKRLRGSGGEQERMWRSEEKRLHAECLSRVHICHENGVRKWGGEGAQNEYCHHSLRRR